MARRRQASRGTAQGRLTRAAQAWLSLVGREEIADPDYATKTFTAPVWVYALAQILGASTLLIRRKRPLAMAGLLSAINLVVPVWATIFAPHAITAARGNRRSAWVAVTALAVTFLIGAHAWAIDDPITAPLVILCSALLGLYARARAVLAAETTERAAEQARADERVRLAGEMHDVVSHRVSLMVLQASALRTIAPDEQTRAAAEDLRVAGAEALAELRDLLSVLRDGPGPEVVGHGKAGGSAGSIGDDHRSQKDVGDEVSSLVDDSRAVGLPIQLTTSGEPSRPSPTVGRTVVRVVQESLTNVHKHAPGASTVVSVGYAPEVITVQVVNQPSTRVADGALAGSGSGLTGLRHRVEMVGGELQAGPVDDGGFRVCASLPLLTPTERA